MTEFVTVQLSEGILRGAKATSKSGGTYYSFKGVPYAKPPVGPLRFKMAQPPLPWTGVRDALEDASPCTQFNMTIKQFEGSEDCLYLNVYSPKLPENDSEKPTKSVMVWIHGGGFTTGSNNSAKFGPDFLVDEDVVVVVINYRLGVFGFLSVEGPAAPGNMGLKDQVVAFRWVQRNISKFGGDPSNVTIFGESAGASSVHFHMLSPMTKGLFHKAIAESGVALNPWSWEKHPREVAFHLGAVLGHKSEDPNELVEFLQTVDHLELAKAAMKKPLPDRFKHRLLVFPFVPSREAEVEGSEQFIHADPFQLVQEGQYKAVPYLTGFNSQEGLIMLRGASDLSDPETFKRIENNFTEIIKADLRLPDGFNKMDHIISRLRQFYFKDKPVSEETLMEFIDMQSDIQFIEGIHFTVRKMAELSKAPLYYYCFSYDGQLNYCKIGAGLTQPGACHADEVGYLFRMEKLDLYFGPDSPCARTRSQMVKMWTNFAKTGNPTPEEDPLLPVKWAPHTITNPCFLEIGKEFKLDKNPFQDRMLLWEELYKTV